MKNKIDEEVQKTLESLDHVHQADPGPYFYSRLKSRLETPIESNVQWYLKLAFALLLATNLGSYWILGSDPTDNADDAITDEYFDYTINYEELITLEQSDL